MNAKRVIITIVAIVAAGAGTAGILLNTKKAKMRRLAKKTGRAMYTAGTVLRTLSCQNMTE